MVAIYIEIHNPFRIDGYLESDMSEEAISRKLRLHPNKKNNSIILQKSSVSNLVGDKRPNFQFCAESSFDNLGTQSTKCIYIDRSLVDICRSSYKRSENPNDSWPLEKGVVHTILLYNASCRQIIHLHESRPEIFSSFLFPTYEDIFSSAKSAMKLFKFCEINLSEEEVLQVHSFIKSSQRLIVNRADSTDSLDLYIKRTISRFLDRSVHEDFCAITGNHRNYLHE